MSRGKPRAANWWSGAAVEECASCHGEGLKGSEDLPRLPAAPDLHRRASFIPSRTVCAKRYATSLKDIASGLNDDDIIAATAYVGRSFLEPAFLREPDNQLSCAG